MNVMKPMAVAFVASSFAFRGPGAICQTVQPDNARLAAAYAADKAMTGEEDFSKGLASMRSSIVRRFAATKHVSPEVAESDWDKLMLPVIQSSQKAITSTRAAILAKNFSIDELTQIRDFYQTPVGQRLIVTQTEIGKALIEVYRHNTAQMMALLTAEADADQQEQRKQ